MIFKILKANINQGEQPMPRRKQAQAEELVPLLTMMEVQSILRLSKPQIYELMHTHGLPSVKIDGARRFERAKLQAWIEQYREGL